MYLINGRRNGCKTGEPLSTLLFFLLGCLTSFIVDFMPTDKCVATARWYMSSRDDTEIPQELNVITRSYSIYGNSKTEDHLVHVINVLDRFGYKRVALSDEWSLLWAHDYPFQKLSGLKHLKSEQMVNHMPGCGFLTNKVELSTRRLPFLPRAFRLPTQNKEFLQYAKKNPHALFVIKHNEHRRIVIQKQENINLTSVDSFVQEYIQNPLLVDGHKFDIGVYVVVTSIDPLRVYMYSGDVLFRYCLQKYYPFNSSDVEKYVVGDDYIPTWQMPSLAKYMNFFGGGMRDAFDAYMRSRKLDTSKIWTQIENILRETIVEREPEIATVVKSYKIKHFFELMRFDFIITNSLKVYLMEANMSPNLSSAHFKANAILYEKLLYNVFNLVGVGSPLLKQNDINGGAYINSEIVTSNQDLIADLNICAQFDCEIYCNRSECNLCLPCLSGTEYDILKRAHAEHLHKADMKRIYPIPTNIGLKTVSQTNDINKSQKLSDRNSWMMRWYYSRCIRDVSWCH